MKDPCSDPDKYAPVLERMVEILGREDGVSFGVAMDRAAKELHIEVPEYMHEPLLVSAFKVISGGKIPGLPEA